MDRIEAIKVLEKEKFRIVNQYLCSQEKITEEDNNLGNALTLAIEILKRIDSKELWGFLIKTWKPNKKFYDAADLDDISQAIVKYLEVN